MTTLEDIKVKISADTSEFSNSLLDLEDHAKKILEGVRGSLKSDFDDKKKVSPFQEILNLGNEEKLKDVLTKKVFGGGPLSETEKQVLKSLDGIKGVLEDNLRAILNAERKGLEGEGLGEEEIETRLNAISERGNKVIGDLVGDFTDTLEDAVQDLSQKVSAAFVDMALKGEFSIKTIGEIFLKTFLDVVARELIQKPLEDILGVILRTGTGVLIGSATGGEIEAGVPTIINEQGQEVFIPHTPGKIVNASQTRNMFTQSQGIVINQNLSFDTAVKNDMIGTIMQASPLLVEHTKLAVIESLRGRRF